MSAPIYTGFWTNWSRGNIRGATLTLGEASSGLLTAAIATFVTLVGTQLWKILVYIIHQSRCQRSPQDGLHHQQQVVFRNSPTPGSAAWIFLCQSWAWSGRCKKHLVRTLPWATFASVYIALFAVLAVFSSNISSSPGSARLIDGSQCGYWTTTGEDNLMNLAANIQKWSNNRYVLTLPSSASSLTY